MPKWPRLEDPSSWSEKDIAEAVMVNSLHLEAPKRWWVARLQRSLKKSPNNELIHEHTFETGLYTSRNFLSWSRLVEALDLANFDDDIVMLSSTAEAWMPLPAIVELWFAVRNLEQCAI